MTKQKGKTLSNIEDVRKALVSAQSNNYSRFTTGENGLRIRVHGSQVILEETTINGHTSVASWQHDNTPEGIAARIGEATVLLTSLTHKTEESDAAFEINKNIVRPIKSLGDKVTKQWLEELYNQLVIAFPEFAAIVEESQRG